MSSPPGASKTPYHFVDGVVTLTLRIQPGAACSEPAGKHGDQALRLRIAAPPVDGKANKACIRYLAKALNVPIRSVIIVRGESSRDKIIRLESVTSERFQAFISQWDS